MVRFISTITLALVLAAFLPVSVNAEVYYGYDPYYFDDRYGEHPYEIRADMLERRKERVENRKRYGYLYSDQVYYYHPAWAESSELHPYFRNNPEIIYSVQTPFDRWRQNQQPYGYWYDYNYTQNTYNLPIDSYCSNYSFERPNQRTKPYGYECWNNY